MSMIEIVERAGEFAHGGDPIQAAAEWAEYEFTEEEAERWLKSRCFDPWSASILEDCGITPEQVAAETDQGMGDYTDTIGYKYSNMDLPLTTVERIVRQNH